LHINIHAQGVEIRAQALISTPLKNMLSNADVRAAEG